MNIILTPCEHENLNRLEIPRPGDPEPPLGMKSRQEFEFELENLLVVAQTV